MINTTWMTREIEYLESTGTQWIDLGINSKSGYTFDMKLRLSPGTASGEHYIVGGSDSPNRLYFGVWGNTWMIGYGSYYRVGSVTDETDYTIKLIRNVGTQRLIVNGVTEFNADSTSNINSSSPWRLFTRNGTSQNWNIRARLYYATVTQEGVGVVRDLIPVRVGQTGYMYDRVTKRLFGNKGTGSFVLGPDVARPVMGLWGMKSITYVPSDYVTDGIVAWYDGIWNTGWNKHSNTAETWKDLSGGGNDASIVKRDTFARQTTFDANSCTMDGTFCWAFTASNAVVNAIKGDCTIEIIRRLGTPSRQDSTPFFGLNVYGSRAMSMSGASNNCKLRMGMNNEFQAINKGIPGISITISKHIDGSNITVMFYEKGIFKTTQSRTVQAITVTSYGVLFGEGTNLFGGNGNYWQPSPPSDGHAYTLRFYNRALSADEIAHNYAIDKARFNLP